LDRRRWRDCGAGGPETGAPLPDQAAADGELRAEAVFGNPQIEFLRDTVNGSAADRPVVAQREKDGVGQG